MPYTWTAFAEQTEENDRPVVQCSTLPMLQQHPDFLQFNQGIPPDAIELERAERKRAGLVEPGSVSRGLDPAPDFEHADSKNTLNSNGALLTSSQQQQPDRYTEEQIRQQQSQSPGQ